MVGGDGIGNLLEDGRLTRTRRCDNQTARSFANRRDEVNYASLDQVGRCLQIEFLKRVEGG